MPKSCPYMGASFELRDFIKLFITLQAKRCKKPIFFIENFKIITNHGYIHKLNWQ